MSKTTIQTSDGKEYEVEDDCLILKSEALKQIYEKSIIIKNADTQNGLAGAFNIIWEMHTNKKYIDTDILKKEIYKLRDEQCDNLERNEVISEVFTVIDFLTDDIPCSKCSNRDKSRIIQDNDVCSKCEAYSRFNLELKDKNNGDNP